MLPEPEQPDLLGLGFPEQQPFAGFGVRTQVSKSRKLKSRRRARAWGGAPVG